MSTRRRHGGSGCPQRGRLRLRDDRDAPVGLLQPISHDLHVSLEATGRLVTVYAAINVALSAPLAHLTRGLPRKATICAVMAVFVLTSVAAAASPGYGWLMAVRVITALGKPCSGLW